LPAAANVIGKADIPMLDQSVDLKETLKDLLKMCTQKSIYEVAICLHSSDVTRKNLVG